MEEKQVQYKNQKIILLGFNCGLEAFRVWFEVSNNHRTGTTTHGYYLSWYSTDGSECGMSRPRFHWHLVHLSSLSYLSSYRLPCRGLDEFMLPYQFVFICFCLTVRVMFREVSLYAPEFSMPVLTCLLTSSVTQFE